MRSALVRSGAVAITLVFTACAPTPATSAPTASGTTNAPPAAPSSITTTPSPTTAAAVPTGGVRFVAQGTSAATVRVEEHLAVNLVNTDAVLTTDGVRGVLTLNADGSFAADSKIVVDMTKLHSDQALRDKWIQLFGIETNKFKESFFVPERATGLPAPLPPSGSWTFTLDGTLNVHGVAKPVSWKTTVKRSGRDLTGTATVTVRWADFNVERPQAAVFQVVSVSDDIRLELAFVATQSD
jgi:polyisoprenoid-binding protein YceI